MSKKDKIYLVRDDCDSEDPNDGYWLQYSTLEDAVTENNDSEIFEAFPKSLGCFKLKVERKVVKLKKKKAAQ